MRCSSVSTRSSGWKRCCSISVERAVELEIEPRVVEGAVLDLPVAAGVAQHAVVQCRERLGPRRREGVQGAVAAASLEEAEQGATGRYVWIEHGKSLTSSCRRNRDCAFNAVGAMPRSNMIGRPPSSACCRPSSSASRRWPGSGRRRGSRRHDDPAISSPRPHLRERISGSRRVPAGRPCRTCARYPRADGVPAAGSAPRRAGPGSPRPPP